MLGQIKSSFIFKKIIKYIPERIYLKVINHNKFIQKKLNISIDIYIRYFNQIEIEIIVDNNKLYRKTNKFININDEKDEPFYHIYLNDFKKEVKRNHLIKNEIVTKIKVLIDVEVKSLTKIFNECYCVKEIKFIKFNITDFTDYSCMFYYCEKLNKYKYIIVKKNNKS